MRMIFNSMLLSMSLTLQAREEVFLAPSIEGERREEHEDQRAIDPERGRDYFDIYDTQEDTLPKRPLGPLPIKEPASPEGKTKIDTTKQFYDEDDPPHLEKIPPRFLEENR